MSPFSSTSSSEFELVKRELDAGERLLWSGQPDPARMRQRAVPTALFSVPAGAFVVFWMWGASESVRRALAVGKTPDIMSIAFPAFGLLFAGVIVKMALAPYFEFTKARRTFYALTDRRALIVVEGRKRTVNTVMPSEFSVERCDLAGERGDLVLKRSTTGHGDNEKTIEIGFYGIPNARQVEQMARELAQKPR